jgi:peptide subunit release factor RF-3
VDGTSTNGVVELRQVLLQRPEAFRTTITEQLLVFAAMGKVARFAGTPDTLMRARQILRSTAEPRWSAIIAAIAQAKPAATN